MGEVSNRGRVIGAVRVVSPSYSLRPLRLVQSAQSYVLSANKVVGQCQLRVAAHSSGSKSCGTNIASCGVCDYYFKMDPALPEFTDEMPIFGKISDYREGKPFRTHPTVQTWSSACVCVQANRRSDVGQW